MKEKRQLKSRASIWGSWDEPIKFNDYHILPFWRIWLRSHSLDLRNMVMMRN